MTAHHAIIPTPAQGACCARSLGTSEAAVYDLIAHRYIAQFFGPYETIQSELAIDFAGRRFRATGGQVVADGWKTVLHAPEPPEQAADAPSARAADEPDNPSLPPCAVGDPLQAAEITVLSKKTELPKPFTDASLMQAMCGVAKFVRDPAIAKLLSDADGIGTPATRATIIETLFERGYVERRKSNIVSTVTGRTLIDTLPPLATTPDMTAIWEAAMRAILERQQSLDGFLGCVETELRQLVEQAKARGPVPIARAARAISVSESNPGARQAHRPARPPARRSRKPTRAARTSGR